MINLFSNKNLNNTIVKFLSMLFFTLALYTANAQTVIPDAAFEQLLIDKGYDVAPIDGSVPTANINTIKFLNVSNANISDLTGIQDFRDLLGFTCSNNNVTTIDLTNCTNLNSLTANGNDQLVVINTTGNLNLKELNVFGNDNLTTLDVTTNINLEGFQFQSCKVSSIDVSRCVVLNKLFCGNNLLTAINVESNPLLKSFGCNGNAITSIDVTKNTALTYLKVSNIATSTFDFSKNIKLKDLFIINNNVSFLDLSNNPDLEDLHCSKNNLTNLNLNNNPELIILNCDINKLTSLDLKFNINLRTLDCKENKIIDLNITANIALQTLECEENEMKTLTLGVSDQLSNIACNNNAYTELDFSTITSLARVEFNNNPLLKTVNVKNNNNTIINEYFKFRANNCPKLTCIFVDDIVFSSTTWTNIDAASAFVETQAQCDLLLPTPFITTWQTTTANETITIPTFVSETYNYTVDWGDGSSNTNIPGAATHNYVTAGDHIVRISGDFPRIYFANTGDKEKIISIDQWGNNPWVSMDSAFFGCENLEGRATDAPDLSAVISMSSMFNNCAVFNQDINDWDVSSVQNMSYMFNSAIVFNQDLNNLDTKEVTNMLETFQAAHAFNGDISTWNTLKVKNMSNMFKLTKEFNQSIGSWLTNAVTDMSGMFWNAEKFNQDIGGWDISSLLDADLMFAGTIGLSTANYDALLIGWQGQTHNTKVPLTVNTNYCLGETAKIALETDNWTITDAGLSCPTLQYSIDYMSTTNGAIVGDGTTNTNYFGPNDYGSYGDCTSGNWEWIHALCSECSINNKDISVKQNDNNGSTWSAGSGASRYMVIDLSMPRTFNELRVFQMFRSDGKVTSIRMYSHLNTTTVPFYSDADWTPIFTEKTIGAGIITGNTVSIPTIINFPYTTSRFLLIEAKNDGSLGNPSYTEIRELKLFDNNSSTPAPIDLTQTPTFIQVTPICEGGILSTLPTTSTNAITGTWAPALDSTTTTEYTFTPNIGQCASATTMTITVNSTPAEPTGLECWQTNTWNTTSCTWVTTGTKPVEPTGLECWETNTWNTTSCTWVTTGTKPVEPTALECWETNTWNTTSCTWVTTGTQPTEPTALECWQTNTWDTTSCTWVTTGTQPAEPTALECWQTNTWNTTSCTWVTTGTQPAEPTALECWQTNTWNTTSCTWVTTGTQPAEPTALECWQTNTWNTTSCTWVTTGTQPEPINTLPNITFCDSYTLPTLTTGNYFTATGGTGTALNAGDNITSTQTIFIYVGDATCNDESSFTITINTTPTTAILNNQTVCDSYTLPTLTAGNYFTATGGTGTKLNAGDNITISQTVYIYTENGICNDESSFAITIDTKPIANVLASGTFCDSFTLPILSSGNYFTATGGTGTQLNAGNNVTSTQTIYIYTESGICNDESSFTISIDINVDFLLTNTNLEINGKDLSVIMGDDSIDYEYAIDGFSYQDNNAFLGLTVGFHVLFVRDINGCIEKSIDFKIIQFDIPKYFTPNNDGYHDNWQVLDSENSIKTIQIFDRYGKFLKQINPNSLGWDGTINNNKLATNDYWYVIVLQTGKLIKGHFTLKF